MQSFFTCVCVYQYKNMEKKAIYSKDDFFINGSYAKVQRFGVFIKPSSM